MNEINKIYKKNMSPGEFAKGYFDYLNKVLSKIDTNQINKLVKHLEKSRKNGNTIFVIGNGGSATTASSMANDIGFDILKKTGTKKAFKLLSLTDNNAVITAIANDVGYENIFLNQLKIHFKKGDSVIFISASGNSRNLVNAAKWVKKNKGKIIGFLGFDGGKIKNYCDINIHVPSNKGEYGPVEDAHLIINHILAHWFQNSIKD
tara:strand:+ start:1005 stop:1619 length:615 start_codon:yes stop_codon:yes gene_type:complete